MNFEEQFISIERQIYPPIEIETNVIWCDLCSRNIAKFNCSECKINYCLKCEEKSHIPLLKNYHQKMITIIPESKSEDQKTSQNICSKHNREIEYYCFHHQRFICQECIQEECRTHDSLIFDYNKTCNILYYDALNNLDRIQKNVSGLLVLSDQTKENYLNNKKKIRESLDFYNDQIVQIKKGLTKVKEKSMLSIKNIEFIIFNNFNKVLYSKQKKIDKLKKYIKYLKYFIGEEDISEHPEIIENFLLFKKKLNQKDLTKKTKTKKSNLEDNIQTEYKIQRDQWKTKNHSFGLEFYNKKQTCLVTQRQGFFDIYGKNIYKNGLFKIQIQIDRFDKTKESNNIQVGVVGIEVGNKRAKGREKKNSYLYVNEYTLKPQKRNRSYYQKRTQNVFVRSHYIKNNIRKSTYGIDFESGDIITIYLDMIRNNIMFQINNELFPIAFERLPKAVKLMARVNGKRTKKNQITIL
ncbi:hypothetical protein M0813_13060 [Anaeramoeba flamelloides]|uniref:SPRY domain-containing protein n=1 Tax=Anaeramoeba flamelloides TaxID=1746091 RepID=A0ABQ8ZA27_9EUKA|nr:hypothetical protein M0813_13060 [Anaeramoeba flamelloides]